jgi:prophage antirepressor-like protein
MTKNLIPNPTRVQIFENQVFGRVRTLVNEQGEPLFCLKDVCTALELGTSAVRQRLDHDVVSTYTVKDSRGRKNLLNFINEDGLYDVILDSRKPEARAFRKWVTSEVLPQIRRTGGYIPMKDLRTGRELTDEEIVCRAHEIIGRTLAMKNAPNERCQTATQVAEAWGINVTQLNGLLQAVGIIERRGGRWHLAESLAGQGLVEDRHFFCYSLKGKPRATSYLVWTPEGVRFLEKRVRWLANSLPRETRQLLITFNNVLIA